MRRIRHRDEDNIDWQYRADCERIQEVLRARGYEASLSLCYKLWDSYSDSMAASWMHLDEARDWDGDEEAAGDAIFSRIRPYFVEQDGAGEEDEE